MGELIQFRMENEPNSSSGVNIFIPTNCQWSNINIPLTAYCVVRLQNGEGRGGKDEEEEKKREEQQEQAA
jgi:hypothetical protein